MSATEIPPDVHTPTGLHFFLIFDRRTGKWLPHRQASREELPAEQLSFSSHLPPWIFTSRIGAGNVLGRWRRANPHFADQIEIVRVSLREENHLP